VAYARKLEAEQFKSKKAKDLLQLGGASSADDGPAPPPGARQLAGLAYAPGYAGTHYLRRPV
jgi:hypothetical protein